MSTQPVNLYGVWTLQYIYIYIYIYILFYMVEVGSLYYCIGVMLEIELMSDIDIDLISQNHICATYLE